MGCRDMGNMPGFQVCHLGGKWYHYKILKNKEDDEVLARFDISFQASLEPPGGEI